MSRVLQECKRLILIGPIQRLRILGSSEGLELS